MKIAVFALLFALLLCPIYTAAEESSQDIVYTVTDPTGTFLFTFCGILSEGDEYISADNMLYRITTIQNNQATATQMGIESMPDVSWLNTGEAQPVFASQVLPASYNKTNNKKLIAMYVTHSDES